MGVSVLRVERITTFEGLEALEAEWQDLFARCDTGLPFQTWEWQMAWWAHLPETGRFVVDALFVCALRTEAGELVAVAPLMSTRRPGRGPLAFRVLDFIGPDPNLTELRGILAEPVWETRAYAALRRYLGDHADEWDWIHWRGLRQGTAADQALRALPGARAIASTDDWVLPLPATWEQLKSTRGRNLKESLRKCYNSLKREGHAFTLQVASTPPDVSAAVDRLLVLHRARADLQDTIAHRDAFHSPQTRDFLDDVCQRLAVRDQVRVFELVIAGEVVASRIGFALGRTLYLYYSGYQPAWGDHSVMTTCVAEAIQYAIAHGFQAVNLSTGTDVSKTRWGPEQVRYGELVEVASALSRRHAFDAYQGLRKVQARPELGAFARRLMGRRAKGN